MVMFSLIRGAIGYGLPHFNILCIYPRSWTLTKRGGADKIIDIGGRRCCYLLLSPCTWPGGGWHIGDLVVNHETGA